MLRSAKIVATLGPSSSSEEVLTQLIHAGVDVARLNFSHGTHAEHAERIALIRRVSEASGKPVTILQDLQGPKMRVAALQQPIELVPGQKVVFTGSPDFKAQDLPTGATPIPMDFPELAISVTPGSRILLDDGNMELAVTRVLGEAVEAEVIQGGTLKSHKGVNLPGADLPIPGFTEKDREDLEFGLSQGIDAVAVSFVRTPQDVEKVRKAIHDFAPDRVENTPIIAKLERPEALQNLDAILEKTDGVMVARGDLGVEMPPATVPTAQKRIIEAATKQGKYVITATQMLESMIENPRPTRAETSDVANAVYDGSDAVMLSGETAAGSFPLEAVSMMDAIIRQAEEHITEYGRCHPPLDEPTIDDSVSLVRAARQLAYDRDVAAIAVFTRTGHTALLMSKTRPLVPIMAFTPDKRTYPTLSLYWGVSPFLVPIAHTMEEMIQTVEHALLTLTPIRTGQQVILISGYPVSDFRRPNFLMMHTVGEAD
jgi:pyruvate kinase